MQTAKERQTTRWQIPNGQLGFSPAPPSGQAIGGLNFPRIRSLKRGHHLHLEGGVRAGDDQGFDLAFPRFCKGSQAKDLWFPMLAVVNITLHCSAQWARTALRNPCVVPDG